MHNLNLIQTNNLKFISNYLQELVKLDLQNNSIGDKTDHQIFKSVFCTKIIITCSNNLIGQWIENQLLDDLGYSPNIELIDLDTLIFKLCFSLRFRSNNNYIQSFHDSYGTLLWSLFKIIIDLKNLSPEEQQQIPVLEQIFPLINEDSQQINSFRLAKNFENTLQTMQASDPELMIQLLDSSKNQVSLEILKSRIKYQFRNLDNSLPIELENIFYLFQYIWQQLYKEFEIAMPLEKGSIGKKESRFNIERNLLNEIKLKDHPLNLDPITDKFIKDSLNINRIIFIATDDIYFKEYEYLKSLASIEGLQVDVFNLNYCQEIYTKKELNFYRLTEKSNLKDKTTLPQISIAQKIFNSDSSLDSSNMNEIRQKLIEENLSADDSELSHLNSLLVNLGSANFQHLENLAYLLPSKDDNVVKPIENLIGHPQHHYIRVGKIIVTNDDGSSLLEQLQQNILQADVLTSSHVIESSDKLFYLTDQDKSIQIYSHYTTKNELQTIRDQILTLCNNNSSLKLSDILVLVPNIDEFSKPIYQVFNQYSMTNFSVDRNQSDFDNRFIPFNICSKQNNFSQTEQNLLDVLICLVKINTLNFTLDDFDNLLRNPLIIARFNFSNKNIQEIIDLLIKFKYDNKVIGSDKSLERLLTELTNNQFFGPENSLIVPSVSKFKLSIDIEYINLILKFIRTIVVWAKLFAEDGLGYLGLTAREWHITLKDTVDEFILDSDSVVPKNEKVILQASELFKKLFTVLNHSKLFEPNQAGEIPRISRRVIGLYLSDMEISGSVHKLNPWSLNFVDAIKGASIPSKVKFIIGLDSKFVPTSNSLADLDIYHYITNPYHVSIRDSTINSILTSIMSTSDKLIFSYIGKKISDNSDQAPSFILSTLLDYIGNYTRVVVNGSVVVDKNICLSRLIEQASLNPYDRENFDPSSNKLLSYSTEWIDTLTLNDQEINNEEPSLFAQLAQDIDQYIKGIEPLDLASSLSIDLSDLIRFYRSPLNYFEKTQISVSDRVQIKFNKNNSIISQFKPDDLDKVIKGIINNGEFNNVSDDQLADVAIRYFTSLYGVEDKSFADFALNNQDLLIELKAHNRKRVPANESIVSYTTSIKFNNKSCQINIRSNLPIYRDGNELTLSKYNFSRRDKSSKSLTKNIESYFSQMLLTKVIAKKNARRAEEDKLSIKSNQVINIIEKSDSTIIAPNLYKLEVYIEELFVSPNQLDLDEYIKIYLIFKDKFCYLRSSKLDISNKPNGPLGLQQLNDLQDLLTKAFTNCKSYEKLYKEILAIYQNPKFKETIEKLFYKNQNEFKITYKDLNCLDNLLDNPETEQYIQLTMLFYIIYMKSTDGKSSFINWLK